MAWSTTKHVRLSGALLSPPVPGFDGCASPGHRDYDGDTQVQKIAVSHPPGILLWYRHYLKLRSHC